VGLGHRAAPVALLLVVAVAPGRFEPRHMVGGGPFTDRALGGALLVANQLVLALTTLALVVNAGSLVARFRRAHGIERQQLRWWGLAAAVMALAAMVVILAGVATGTQALRGPAPASVPPGAVRWSVSPGRGRGGPG
jgi:hypothetical protein